MSYKLINEETLSDIADAIRETTGKTEEMSPLEMPAEITENLVSSKKIEEIVDGTQVVGKAAADGNGENIASTYARQDTTYTKAEVDASLKELDDAKYDKTGGTITGDVVVTGDLAINGTTTKVNTTDLEIADKLITLAKGNTVPLTSLAGFYVPKYDGENDGALVFDNTGTAYVGDCTIDENGNISVYGDLQPLTTRADGSSLENNHLMKWNSEKQRLEDSGYSVTDLEGKLDKVTGTTTYAQAYIKNTTGAQSVYNMSSSNVANTLMTRDSNGRSKINTPTDDLDIANKKYVDNLLATLNTTLENVSTQLDLANSIVGE